MKPRTPLIRFRDFKPSDLEALRATNKPTEADAAPLAPLSEPEALSTPQEPSRRLLGFKDWLASKKIKSQTS